MPSEDDVDHIPSEMTRDELLVFNTMFFLLSECSSKLDIIGMLGAFERRPQARADLMSVLLQDAESGIQRAFTVPPPDEQH